MATISELKGKLQTFADINRYLTLLRVPEADLELLSLELRAAEGADDDTTKNAALKNVEQLAIELERKVISQATQPSRHTANDNNTNHAERQRSPEPRLREDTTSPPAAHRSEDELDEQRGRDHEPQRSAGYGDGRRSETPDHDRDRSYPSRSYSRGHSRSPSRPTPGDDRWTGDRSDRAPYNRSISPYSARETSRSPSRGARGPSYPPSRHHNNHGARDSMPYRGRSPPGRGPAPTHWHNNRNRSYSPGAAKRPRGPSRSPQGRASPKRYRQDGPPARFAPRDRPPPPADKGLLPSKFRDGMLLNLNNSAYSAMMEHQRLRNMSGTDDIHRISDETMLVVWNFEKKHLCGVMQKSGMLRRIDSETSEVPVTMYQRFVPLPEVVVEQVVQRQAPRGGFKKSKLFRTHLNASQCEQLWRCFNGKPI